MLPISNVQADDDEDDGGDDDGGDDAGTTVSGGDKSRATTLSCISVKTQWLVSWEGKTLTINATAGCCCCCFCGDASGAKASPESMRAMALRRTNGDARGFFDDISSTLLLLVSLLVASFLVRRRRLRPRDLLRSIGTYRTVPSSYFYY